MQNTQRFPTIDTWIRYFDMCEAKGWKPCLNTAKAMQKLFEVSEGKGWEPCARVE